MSSPSDRWCGSGGRAVGMRKRPLTGVFCSALRSAPLPFSIIVVMSCSRSSAEDHELIVMSTLALAPVAMLLMLMANASISSCSCWARTEAVAGASSRTAVTMLNTDGADLTDSSSSRRARRCRQGLLRGRHDRQQQGFRPRDVDAVADLQLGEGVLVGDLGAVGPVLRALQRDRRHVHVDRGD